MLPRTAGGLIGFLFMALLTVMVGLWIVNRVPFLQAIIAQRNV